MPEPHTMSVQSRLSLEGPREEKGLAKTPPNLFNLTDKFLIGTIQLYDQFTTARMNDFFNESRAVVR